MTPSDEIHYDPMANRVLHTEQEAAQRRKTGRMEMEYMACNAGRIADLSAGGLRLIGPPLPTATLIPLRLTIEELVVELNGRLVWIHPLNRKEVEMGIEFVAVTAEQRARLTQLATTHRMRRVM